MSAMNDKMWAYMGRWAANNGVDLRTKEGLKQAEQAWDYHLESQCSCSDPIDQECTTITNCEICGTLSTEPLCTTCQVLYPEG
jgi:hypothetical protein